jgi:hypothetical protein
MAMTTLECAAQPTKPVGPCPGTLPDQPQETPQRLSPPPIAADAATDQAPPMRIDAPAWPRVFPGL